MKVGDKVVCIRFDGLEFLQNVAMRLEKDKVYTVSKIEETNLWLDNLDFGYAMNRFKLFEEPQVIQTCTCSILQLLKEGCKCGQMSREKLAKV